MKFSAWVFALAFGVSFFFFSPHFLVFLLIHFDMKEDGRQTDKSCYSELLLTEDNIFGRKMNGIFWAVKCRQSSKTRESRTKLISHQEQTKKKKEEKFQFIHQKWIKTRLEEFSYTFFVIYISTKLWEIVQLCKVL